MGVSAYSTLELYCCGAVLRTSAPSSTFRPEDLSQGDLAPNYDFRGFYASIVERWLGLDSVPIVGGTFEQLSFV